MWQPILRWSRFLVTITLSLTLMSACSDYGDDEDEDADETTSPVAGETNQVEVTLTEYSIEMPATLSAGQTAFVVTNEGSEEHNFEVEGQGIEEEFEENLGPGETKTLTVDLQAGTYEIYCPVDAHDELGMELELTVQ